MMKQMEQTSESITLDSKKIQIYCNTLQKNGAISKSDKKRSVLAPGKVPVLSMVRRFESEIVTGISLFNPFIILLTILIFHILDSLFHLINLIPNKIAFKIL